MQFGENTARAPIFYQLATFALVVAILRVAEDVLLPIAFAVLLAFLLSPMVVRLVRWRFPRTIAIMTTVVIAFTIIGIVGWIVSTQAISLIRELPNYEQNIQRKIAALKQPQMPSVVARMGGMIENLRKEIKTPTPEQAAKEAESALASPEPKPVPVEVHPPEPSPLELARDIASPILGPLGIAGIVIVFVVAILFQREDLRDRFIKVISAGKLNVATQAIDDAATRVSRYLGMQLVVNATYGVPIGVGLHFIGIPNAPLWGLLATLLRFIPFVGPWIAACFPLALAIAVDPGWTKFLLCAGLFVVMEVISNNWIELVLYGASTGISNFALLVAAVFWTWLWGPAGLVLSTPLTVCVLVLGNHVPGFKFLSMLLGSDPVLEPPAQFYQRMLSMESEDMIELANKFIAERSLEEFYDDVFVPALLMAERDRHSGALPEERQRFILQASRDLIEELERQEVVASQPEGADSSAPFSPAAAPLVLAIPARDAADEIVGLMLCHLLRRRGIPADAISHLSDPDTATEAIRKVGAKAAVISALPPSAVVGARRLWRRVNARFPDLPLVVGIWQYDNALNELADRLRTNRPNDVVTTLDRAIAHLESALPAEIAQLAAPADTPTLGMAAEKIAPE